LLTNLPCRTCPSHRNQLSPNARPDRHALRPLTLWGFEGSPFVRPVREALSSLGLRYTLVSCARGSANRDRMFRKTGRFQAPYLEDPNTGVCMYESGEIVKYLTAAYTVPAAEQGQQA
jgi:glutathione S-transferase